MPHYLNGAQITTAYRNSTQISTRFLNGVQVGYDHVILENGVSNYGGLTNRLIDSVTNGTGTINSTGLVLSLQAGRMQYSLANQVPFAGFRYLNFRISQFKTDVLPGGYMMVGYNSISNGWIHVAPSAWWRQGNGSTVSAGTVFTMDMQASGALTQGYINVELFVWGVYPTQITIDRIWLSN